MTARYGQIWEYGRNETPSSELGNTRTIAGKALWYGHSTDSTFGAPSQGVVGYFDGTNKYRSHSILAIPMPLTSRAGHRVVEAILHLAVKNQTWSSFPGASVNIDVYGVRRAIDMTDADWDSYDTTGPLPWTRLGGEPGTDMDSSPIATWIFTLEDSQGSPAYNNPDFYEIDITSEVDRALKRALPFIYLMFRPGSGWGIPSGANQQFVTIDDPDGDATYPHSWVNLVTTPARAFYGGRAGDEAKIDLARFKDPAVADIAAHINTGTPQAGSSGGWVSTHFANTVENDLLRNVIIGGHSHCGTPKLTGTGVTLRAGRPFNASASAGTSDGEFRIVPKPTEEGTKYQVYFTPLYGTEDVSPLLDTGGNNFGRYDTDTTFRRNSKDVLTILSRWWSAGTPASEVWRIKALGDKRGSYLAAAADRHNIAPFYGMHDGGITDDRTLPFSAQARVVSAATWQQLRASSFTQTYSGSNRTWLPVRDGARFSVGQKVTVSDSSCTLVEHAEVLAALQADGTNPDTIICTTVLTNSYTSTGFVCSGVVLGTLVNADRGRLAANVAIGASTATLDVVITAASGSLRLYNAATGASETISFTRSGSALTFPAPGLVNAYSLGDQVMVEEGTSVSYLPFFAEFKPEDGATTGENLAFLHALSVELI